MAITSPARAAHGHARPPAGHSNPRRAQPPAEPCDHPEGAWWVCWGSGGVVTGHTTCPRTGPALLAAHPADRAATVPSTTETGATP